jgi:hypothetical protein
LASQVIDMRLAVLGGEDLSIQVTAVLGQGFVSGCRRPPPQDRV